MKDKLKKYLLPNLPYLFFVYLFDKLCQTVRLAPGLDASEKLLHIGQGFQTAFSSSAPSFHALDICVGILGAVFGHTLLNAMRIRTKAARGLAMGTASHALGTARCAELDYQEGAFSSLALVLCGIITSLIAPFLFPIILAVMG